MTEDTERRLSAIVAADVVGYSRLMGNDETGTLAALRGHRAALIDPLIAEHRGRIVKTMGDGLLLEFQSVVDAARCAIAFQHGMAERNEGVADDAALRWRIGVHLGDVIVEGEDIFGDGVNVAARIEGLAETGGIAISDDAHRLVRDRLDVTWRDGGEHDVKNIARAIAIWRWSTDESSTDATVAADAPPAVPDEPSIAVLPFDNMSGDAEQEYFADGITEDIITEISKFPGLLVISRNSTFTYKGRAVRTQEVCRDLGVRYVLEGSVRKAGTRVRITAQLIDGTSEGHVWAERYDRDLADVFAVQDDVTGEIVRALEGNLAAMPEAVPARVETEIPEAYDCMLRGREQYRLFTKDGNLEARRLYEKAIARDPAYAAAHAGLALAALHEWFHGTPDGLDRAYAHALDAQSHDATIPLVYEALGNIHLFRKEYDEAVVAARRWLEVEPGDADAHANLAGALTLSGEPAEALPLIDKAIRLNPFYPFYYILYRGQALFALERYDEALEASKRSTAQNPDDIHAHVFVTACHGMRGDTASARAALAEVLRINPEYSIALARAVFSFKRAADLERLVDGLRRAGLPE
jgi:adenylate cyclase